ncbi:MAG: ABC transporter substrate-binding protein [Caldilineaceae bacterium]|nr:ABC transporter substrate-binding protein [Caldilineaceae bacterium]
MMRISRRWLLILFVWLIAGCAPAAPTPATGESSAVTTPGSGETTVLRIGRASSPDTLNPGAAILASAYTIFELIYDSMYQLELDGTFSLELAESVDVSEDGTVWTFTIHDNVVWHDGQPLTAADIAFSYNFYQRTESFPYLPYYTGYFESVEAPDATTVVITLSEPIPNMESQLVFLYILPEHIWSEFEGDAAVEFENVEMIGSGPFKMLDYRQNEFVRLGANQDHFLYSPRIDEVIFQTFTNQDALVQAIRIGQVDLITEMPNTAVPALRNATNVEVVIGPPVSPSVSDVIFNQVAPENCPPDAACTGHPALRDRNLRLALAHATDKEQIIDVTLLGLGTPGITLIPDGLGVWFNDEIEDYAFDPALANEILDGAGYLDTNNDGVRELPDGSRPLVFRVNWPNDTTWAQRGAELMGQMWAQVGVRIEPQAFDPDALTALCCPTFDFDIILWGWVADPDPGSLLNVMTTAEIESGNNETGYSNPVYDELHAQQATTLDAEARRQIVWEMQRIVHADVAYIIPFYSQATQAYRTDRFRGWIVDEGKIALEDLSSLLVVEPVE